MIFVSLFPSFLLACAKKHLVFASVNIVNISESNGKTNSGVAIELLNQLSAKLDFSYEVNYYPWSRAIKVMQSGKADALIGVYYTPARAEFMDYGRVALYQDEIRLFSQRQDKFTWLNNMAQLQNKRIALIRGGSYGANLDEYKNQMAVMDVSSVDQQFMLLAKGRVDFTANNVRTTQQILNRLGLQHQLVSHTPALTVLPGYFAFSKQSKYKALLAEFDQYLTELESSGELSALQHRLNPPVGSSITY